MKNLSRTWVDWIEIPELTAIIYGLVQFFVVFEKFTCAYLFQIALEIIWLRIQIREE